MIVPCLTEAHSNRARAVLGGMPRVVMSAAVLLCGLYSQPAFAADRYSAEDLMSMKIEDLVNVKVTTLSKREEKYMRTAGAVFVITRDDIRRSGARSIPDALRLAPGLQVSQSNMNQWQIGIRGQSDFFTDLLLVMVDGRPVYTTTFSGVWWVTQNYPLEDIERIEIVRGPGGAIWGSNAVNGVINIITRKAGASRGFRISGGVGTEDKAFGNMRYSGRVGKVDYRIYTMQENRDGGLVVPNAHPGYTTNLAAPDFRDMNQQGFRMDWVGDGGGRYALHGDRYDIKTGLDNYWQPVVRLPALPSTTFDYRGVNVFSGGNLVFHMEKDLRPDVTFKGKFLFDRYNIHTKVFTERKDTYDGDFQVDFSDVMHQNISLGMDLRRMHAVWKNTPQFQMPSRYTNLVSFFVNDELNLFDGMLRVIGGIKMERNSYTKWIAQPSLRAIVSDDNWAVWAAASQAARTPNDMENGLRWNLRVTGNAGTWYQLQQVGDGRARTEKVVSYEVGARVRPTEESLVELTAFTINYNGVLDTWQNRHPANNTYMARGIIPEFLTNVLNGYGTGLEANFRWRLFGDFMTLKGSYTFLHQSYHATPISDNETYWTVLSNIAQDPKHRWHVGLSLNPTRHIEFDTNLYYTGTFRGGDVPHYHRLDMRLGWKPSDELEMSVVGQDLMRASYQSNVDSIMGYASRIQQRYYFNVTYRH